MQRIVIVANFTFVFFAVAHIGNVCSFLRSGQIYRLVQKQWHKNYQHVIQGVARNGGGDGKKRQPKINIKDLPPLAGAVMNNANINTLSKLIESGADVNAVGGESLSALHIASGKGLTEVVAFLMKNGADINRPERSGGCTPLMIAVALKNLETVSKLLELGADVSAVDLEGNSALHNACKNNISNIIAELISHGADLNQRNNEGKTPFMRIAQQGHPETVRSLLELGADVNVMDLYGNTALHFACGKGDFLKIVDILLTNGADINHRGDQGYTPLMVASQQGCLQAVIKLLDLGSEVDILSDYGESALNIARKKGHTAIAKKIERIALHGAEKLLSDSESLLKG